MIKELMNDKAKLKRVIALSLLVFIFVFLSISFMANYVVTLVLAALAFLISIYLAKDRLKEVDKTSILIYLIPVISLGLFYAISNFSNQYVSLADRIFIPVALILFAFTGTLFKYIDKFEIKWIFVGILSGLAIISLINLVTTLYQYGPFHGIRFSDYYSYYDGTRAMDTLAGTAFAMCGFSIKQVPIQYYLLFPCLLLSSGFYYLYNPRRCKYNIIFSAILFLVALISIFFVISRITLVVVGFCLVFDLVIFAFVFFKIKWNKPLKIVGYSLLGLFALVSIFTFLNAQISFAGLKEFTSSNSLLNYLFNTNRYSKGINLILNGIFSVDKFIGFPLLFDEGYASIAYPSGNIFVNQFMYGGIFAFLFFALIFISIILNFTKAKKNNESSFNVVVPFIFVLVFFIFSFISDVSLTDEVVFDTFVYTPFNPYFLIVVMIGGYYSSLANKEKKEVNNNEE